VAINVACKHAVSDQIAFGWNDQKFPRFTALLDAPPNANPADDRLRNVKTPEP
jgi:uncharacterized protein (DUF1778 family)